MELDIIHKGSLLEGDDLLKENRNRKKSELEMSIGITELVPESWTLKREYKNSRRIVKTKDIADQLEDKV